MTGQTLSCPPLIAAIVSFAFLKAHFNGVSVCPALPAPHALSLRWRVIPAEEIPGPAVRLQRPAGISDTQRGKWQQHQDFLQPFNPNGFPHYYTLKAQNFSGFASSPRA